MPSTQVLKQRLDAIAFSLRALQQRLDEEGPYTDPELRNRLKSKIMAGSNGGNPGQWSARKAQLLALEYKKAGGGYKKGKTKAQRSLKQWTKEEWGTKSGKPSLETGERYLPKKAIANLSPQAYAATSKAKREGMKKGEQFVPQTPKAKERSRQFRGDASI